MITLDTVAKFTWGFGRMFHLKTKDGCFNWSDPRYGGDNTIRPTTEYHEWIGKGFGRDKGNSTIRDYCGPDVKIFSA